MEYQIVRKKGKYYMVDQEEQLEQFLIPEVVYTKYSLYEAEAFDEASMRTIRFHSDNVRGRMVAMRYLSYGLKAKHAIISKLCAAGITDRSIEAVIELLSQDGYLDDRELIRRMAVDRMRFAPRSEKTLKFDLLKKGFLREDVEHVIGQLTMKPDHLAMMVLKKYSKRATDTAAMLKVLRNKGFDYETSKRAIEQAILDASDSGDYG